MHRLPGLIIFVITSLFLVGSGLTGCDQAESDDSEEHAVVESGTYEGIIAEVNADEDEIYVEVDGQELELYFTEQTLLTQGGEPAEFSVLAEGQTVEVEVEKVGQRLDPLSVDIRE